MANYNPQNGNFASKWRRDNQSRKTERFRVPSDMADKLYAIAQIADQHPNPEAVLEKLLEVAETL